MVSRSRSSCVTEYVDPAAVAEEYTLTGDEHAAVDRVNQRVAAGDSLPAILDFVFDATHAHYPCDRISVAFLQEGDSVVVSHVTRAQYEPVLLDTGYAEPLRRSSLAAVARTRRLRIIHDLERYGARKPDSPSTRLLLREGVRASLTCPLEVDGRRIGFLFRSAREPGVYTRRHALLHLRVAERLSQAVEKAWRIERLEQANRAYLEMLGFVSHELKSPVASLVMDANLLLGGYIGDLEPKQREQVEKMRRKGAYLLGLVREYLDLARIEEGRLRLEPRDVDIAREVVAPALDIVQPPANEKGMALEVHVPDGLPPVTCDPGLLQIVLVNLLTNAAKYGSNGGRIVLRVELTDNDESPGDGTDDAGPGSAVAGGDGSMHAEDGAPRRMLRVSVWNTGPGFPPGERGKLFRKFSRLDTPALRQERGTGVGLYTSARIIDLHHGRIDAQSEEGHWAEFSFQVPAE